MHGYQPRRENQGTELRSLRTIGEAFPHVAHPSFGRRFLTRRFARVANHGFGGGDRWPRAVREKIHAAGGTQVLRKSQITNVQRPNQPGMWLSRLVPSLFGSLAI